MINIAGLYLKKNEKGETFFVGKINENTSIFIFKNKNKKEDRHPDYQAFIAENKPKGERKAPAQNKTDEPEF
jgi:hypothetical protein